jgi:hypothetical protein
LHKGFSEKSNQRSLTQPEARGQTNPAGISLSVVGRFLTGSRQNGADHLWEAAMTANEEPGTWVQWKERHPRWRHLPGRIEWRLEWLVYWCRDLAIFEVLEFAGRLIAVVSVAVALIVWIWEAGDREKQKHYRAWELINSARGSTGDGGRRDALQDLNEDGEPLAAAPLAKAYLAEVQLSNAKLDQADLSETNLTGANLIRADLSGATLENTTFCRTTMPDGTVNNPDCSSGKILEVIARQL